MIIRYIFVHILFVFQDSYGFIKCPSKEGSLIYFKVTELLDPQVCLKLHDEVEFTYVSDNQNKRCQAIRISTLPNGTLFNILSSKKFVPPGFDTEVKSYPLIDFNTDLNDTQNSKVQLNGNGENYSTNNCANDVLSMFNKSENQTNNSISPDASENQDLLDTINSFNDGKMTAFETNKDGVIVALKENYGFIESIDGENEYFFHISSYIDENGKLGQAVEFNTFFANGKWKASDVRQKQSISLYEGLLSEFYNGIVIRTIQPFESKQDEYTGEIARFENSNDTNDGLNINDKYEFSMISCKFLKDYIAVDDIVKFQVGTNSITKKKRAFNVEVVRERTKVFLELIFFCLLI